MTFYLEAQQLESELRKRSEFKSLGVAIVRDKKLADLRIEINRAEFSFNYTYRVTNPQTSVVVASGKVTARNGDFAAPQIAQEILKEISAAAKFLPISRAGVKTNRPAMLRPQAAAVRQRPYLKRFKH